MLMRRIVLRVDAVFLTVAGVFGLVSDLQSYVSGTGPFGQTFFQNPTVIGVVEAHGARRSDCRHPLVSGNTSHETFRALGRGYCPCCHGRQQHRLVRCVQARAGGDSRRGGHGGAFCLHWRQRILHYQSRRQPGLTDEPTGFVWYWACSWSSASFMARRRSSGAIAGRRASSLARWSWPRLLRPSGFCCVGGSGRPFDNLALDGRVQRALSSRAAPRSSCSCWAFCSCGREG